MANDGYTTITPELIAEWEAEVAALQRKIAAGKVFLPADSVEDDGARQNFMGTMADIVNTAAKPIAKADLKEMMKKRGFPEHQVAGTYFYLAIKKLKAAERVSVLADGSIGKGSRRI